MIDKQFQSKERKKSKMEDMLWVSMDVGKEKWFVGGAYIVPVSSSRWRRAEDLVVKDIARFTEEGQVVVAGDWNSSP